MHFPRISRISLVAAGFVAALALGACGGGNTSVSARQASTTTSSSTTTTTTTEPASTSPPASSTPSSTAPSSTVPKVNGFKAVEYGGVRFQVPNDWPVYDLAKDPTRCVRFDQHAVYLGHAGANQDCPAQLVGRTETVQVEPIDAQSQTAVSSATAPGTINGLSVRLDPNSAITHSLVAAFDESGLVATVTFRQSDTLAQKILGTFERAGA